MVGSAARAPHPAAAERDPRRGRGASKRCSACARRSSAGGDFATIARTMSEDTASATDGGDLGWISPGDIVPEFEQVVATLPLNELEPADQEPLRLAPRPGARPPLARHHRRGEARGMRAPDSREQGRGGARAMVAALARPSVRRDPSLARRARGHSTPHRSTAARARSCLNAIVSTDLPVIVVSSGEPAGIGPDICLALAQREIPARLAVLGDPSLFADRVARARRARRAARVRRRLRRSGPHLAGSLQVMPIAAAHARAWPAASTSRMRPYVLDMLRRGVALCSAQAAQALVTAPVQKSVITDSGFEFSGHTEFLASSRARRAARDAARGQVAARGARDHAPAAARGAATRSRASRVSSDPAHHARGSATRFAHRRGRACSCWA